MPASRPLARLEPRLGGEWDYVSPGEIFVIEGVFVPYRWRDERRMTPRRLRELAEWDQREAAERALGAAISAGRWAGRATS